MEKMRYNFDELLKFFCILSVVAIGIFSIVGSNGGGGSGTEGTTDGDTVDLHVPIDISNSNVRDTGQNNCYSNEDQIDCPEKGDDFYGQDAHYSTNPMQFTINGSVVTDTNNGLIWQQADDGLTYNWFQAMGIIDAMYNPGIIDVCGSLELGGYSDWRLPSRRELVSLINYSQYDAADTAYFQNSGKEYWTSTTSPNVSSDVAWGIFNNGVSYGFGSKGDYGMYVRCVRGGSWGQNDLLDNGNGTVSDNMSGLVWQQNDDGVARNWKESLSYCEKLVLADNSNWRLPDIKELESLVTINASDETYYLPAIDTIFFPTTQNADYWSSTSSPPNAAFGVDFALGWVDTDGIKSNYKLCRCVR